MTWFRSIMKVFGLKKEIPMYLNDDHNSAYRAFDTNYGTQEILNLSRISTFLQNYAPNRFYYFENDEIIQDMFQCRLESFYIKFFIL